MKHYIYILILVFSFSCSKGIVKKPTNFIPKDKMINLLVDMKIAGKTRNYKNLELKKKVNYMSFVFNKYQIDSTQFKENNRYYIHHIEQYQEIYEAVEKRLKDSLAKYEKIIKLNDSLKLMDKKMLKKKERKKKFAPKTEKSFLSE